MGSLGIQPGNQIYLGLPDGRLDQPEAGLDEAFEAIVRDIRPDRIFTTGAKGYDGHPDHIAVHLAAVRAGESLRRLGHEVAVWALAADNQGEFVIAGNLQQKLGSMSFHLSQKVGDDLARWGGTDVYLPVISGPETYDRIM